MKQAFAVDKKLANDIFNILLQSMGPMHIETLFSLLFIQDKFSESEVTNAKSILQICA